MVTYFVCDERCYGIGKKFVLFVKRLSFAFEMQHTHLHLICQVGLKGGFSK